MKKISKFDIGYIIAVVVVGLLGGAGVWWESTQLSAAQDDAANAKKDFDTYSIKEGIVVSTSNRKTLQDNIDLLKGQLDPLITVQFQQKDNKLNAVQKVDPVAWKHNLDDEVRRLGTAANHRNVKLPPSFYFGFDRYLNQNPDDDQTEVLSKQLLAVEQIANILTNAPVKEIRSIKRTYEEDPHSSARPGTDPYAISENQDHLDGYSFGAGNNGEIYTDYPFMVDFVGTGTSLRKVMSDLVQSPYIFVVRSLTIESTIPNSPQLSSLDKIAGTPASSVVDSSPGQVAATTSTAPPQFLFGNANLHVKARIDLIEWNIPASVASNATNPGGSNNPNPSPSGN